MGHNEPYLRADEFTRRMDAFERTVLAGQDRIETKVDGHGERIAVLEASNKVLEAVNKTDRNKHVVKTAGWSTLAAGGVTLLIKIVEAISSSAPHAAK